MALVIFFPEGDDRSSASVINYQVVIRLSSNYGISL